jgi:hypothetical protein
MATTAALSTDQRNLRRFLQFQAAGADEKAYELVAAAEKVSVTSVRRSVEIVEGYRNKNSRSEFDLAVYDLVIANVPTAKKTLASLLGATELVEKTDRKGKKVTVREPDKTTRLEALKLVRSLIADMQPKAPLIENHNSNTNQTALIVPQGAETNEDRLRRLRSMAKKHNELPPEVAAVPEYIDAGEDEDDDDDDDEEGDD